MSSILIELLQKAVAKPSRMLMRDHMELAHLQYNKDVSRFVESSVGRIKQNMHKFFEEEREIKVLFSDEIESLHEYENEEELCIINPIEGIKNFGTALPFFGVVLFMRQKGRNATSACVIDFPALQQTMYASEEEGAWITQSLPHLTTQKLKCPKRAQKAYRKEVVICSNNPKDKEEYNATELLNFGSLTYSALCMFRNSISACFATKIDLVTKKALELMTKEYGGQVMNTKDEKFGIYLDKIHTKDVLTLSCKAL